MAYRQFNDQLTVKLRKSIRWQDQPTLRLAGKPELGAFLQLPMLSDVYEDAASRFDIIHSHIDYWSFAFARLINVPTVATMHGRLDVEELHPVYARYRNVPLVSINWSVLFRVVISRKWS